MLEHASAEARRYSTLRVMDERRRSAVLRAAFLPLIADDQAPRLLGAEPIAGLVACALAPGGRAMRLYRRRGPVIAVETVAFSPFLLLASPAAIAGAAGLVDVSALEGPGDLAWLARFDSWTSAQSARDRVRDTPHWFAGDPVHQFLLVTGYTAFGGMRFDDLRRLSLDIEVLTTEGFEFPSAARAGDRIIAIALAEPTGFRHVLRGDRLSEPALLEELARLIRERDPDVIEGHNIFRFDLEYIEARARLHGIALTWGRGGEAVRSRAAQLSVAERTIGYRRYEIPGRHIIDTYLLAQLHDAGTRDLPGFGLKDLARHFGVAARDRTYLDPSTIPRVFRDAPDDLMSYAGDDAVEAQALSAILAPPYFAQAQLIPFDFQTTVLRGAAAKIDALLLREYLRRRHAVPLPGPPAPVGGGHTAILQQGVARPVWHVDVTSLYPSIMLAEDMAPALRLAARIPAAPPDPDRVPTAREAQAARGGRPARARPSRGAAAGVQDPHQRLLWLPCFQSRALE